MKLIYVAGPITGDELANVGRGIEVANQIADLGFAVICPHSMSALMHMRKPRTHQEWLRIDLAIIKRCDAIFRMPGISKGAEMEEVHAKAHKIPVFYNLEELKKWREENFISRSKSLTETG